MACLRTNKNKLFEHFSCLYNWQCPINTGMTVVLEKQVLNEFLGNRICPIAETRICVGPFWLAIFLKSICSSIGGPHLHSQLIPELGSKVLVYRLTPHRSQLRRHRNCYFSVPVRSFCRQPPFYVVVISISATAPVRSLGKEKFK